MNLSLVKLSSSEMKTALLTIVLLVLIPNVSQAQTESVLYNFDLKLGDGYSPSAGLVMDKAGNFYGATETSSGSPNCGAVFQLTPALVYTNITFNKANGCYPGTALVLDKSGNLWGATALGGSSNYGVVFELASGAGTITDVYNFTGLSDGCEPGGPLFIDSAGNLYGTTGFGGNGTNCGTGGGNGVVFKMTPAGVITVLYSFSGTDGAQPGSVIRDSHGNLFGTTFNGGTSGFGTVFEITAAGTEKVLYSFTGGNDGGNPQAGLILKGKTLYGTTYQGGASSGGTVFKLIYSARTRKWKEKVLYSFTGTTDGKRPNGGLIRDRSGNLYGTTVQAGTNSGGTAFKVSPAGTFTLLHGFGASGDGKQPQSGLLMDASGNLYGTTSAGGANLVGTVYKIVP